MSLMSIACDRPFDSIRDNASRKLPPSPDAAPASCVQAKIAFKGVRRSWHTAAITRAFSTLAASVAARNFLLRRDRCAQRRSARR
jgi:hypothetical protein